MGPDGGQRSPEAGLTLVEMLVVLALVGVLAGMLSLSLGRLGTGPSLAASGDTLATRFGMAAETAVLTGRDAAFSWEAGSYRFLSLEDGEWAPHPVPELGRLEQLPGGVELDVDGERRGSLRVPADLAPPDPAPLTATLTDRGARVAVIFDGFAARSREVTQ